MRHNYRAYAVVNLKNIYHNVKKIKEKSNNKMVMPVVKADGYGHGAVKVAKAIYDISDGFLVATIDEAIELRSALINKPILILGTLMEHEYEKAVEYDIIVPLYTIDMALLLNEEAKKAQKKAKCHLVVDTGMNRIGMNDNDEGIKLCEKINNLEFVEIDGIFSHFALSDAKDKTCLNTQMSRFNNFLNKLKDKDINIPHKHIFNSAAIVDVTCDDYDIVRPGIITYGLSPSDEIDISSLNLKEAMEIKSHITYIKTIKDGETVSYGNTYKAIGERKIATIPVGYADGYPRLLSSVGRVLINGSYAPIAGRICMDQFMVDVTDVDCKIGDEVTLIGQDGDLFISADEVAKHAMTINYEIICSFGKRVRRIYIEE